MWSWCSLLRLSLAVLGIFLLFSFTIPNAYAIERIHLNVPLHSVEVDKAFDDVVEDLLLAIASENFLLTEHAKIGQAIREREGKTFPLVTVLHFCNLTYAKELLSLAPDYAIRMPCRISIRQLANGKVMIQAMLLANNSDNTKLNAFADKINLILLDIVAEGAS